ncbi:SMI1/KNR4 family protein [Paenibacillus gansuensis]|uniref:SMI1/KNR4 family protein n=1 Tax=Paenibacillus gansuensis TaxID=306542 RepID=A0ABW5PG04_9BACL
MNNQFWDDSDYYTISNPVSDETINEAEKELGYKLPSTYIELIRSKNGGTPINTCFRTTKATSWAEDHIAITAIHGIGEPSGIDSKEYGSKFMIEDWGYPDIGIVICSCPSAGHDAVMLDYSECGKNGEPKVIHVDVESLNGPKITFLAKDFESFISNLVNENEFSI